MELILQGIAKAFWLLLTGDPEVLGITLLSLKVSGLATFLALLSGIPTGALLALTRFQAIAEQVQARRLEPGRCGRIRL